jgi:hypothetical protein
LQSAVAQVTRSPNLCVQDILQQGRVASPVLHDDLSPHYVCNKRGAPLSALPTIVAFPQSHAFRPGRQGAVRDEGRGDGLNQTPTNVSLPWGTR